MNKIKTISFDLWGTLIKSNPEYRSKRAKIVQNFCPNLSLEDIEMTFQNVKKDIDSNVEKFGLSYNAIDIYEIIINELNINHSVSANMLKVFCENVFIENPPSLYDEDTEEVLKLLYEQDYKLILSSNTLMIESHILLELLVNLNIAKYFNDFIFSDVIKVSKPSVHFFQELQIRSKCLKEHIVHVGDNYITDYVGAHNYGLKRYSIHSKSNKETINDFYKYLKYYNEHA